MGNEYKYDALGYNQDPESGTLLQNYGQNGQPFTYAVAPPLTCVTASAVPYFYPPNPTGYGSYNEYVAALSQAISSGLVDHGHPALPVRLFPAAIAPVDPPIPFVRRA